MHIIKLSLIYIFKAKPIIYNLIIYKYRIPTQSQRDDGTGNEVVSCQLSFWRFSARSGTSRVTSPSVLWPMEPFTAPSLLQEHPVHWGLEAQRLSRTAPVVEDAIGKDPPDPRTCVSQPQLAKTLGGLRPKLSGRTSSREGTLRAGWCEPAGAWTCDTGAPPSGAASRADAGSMRDGRAGACGWGLGSS
jgi:hypothetical protein